MYPEIGNEMEKLDPNILSGMDSPSPYFLPENTEVLAYARHGLNSSWATFFKISVRHAGGDEENYFMKVSIGHHGREALKGEFTATSAIHERVPGFCPKPIAWGTFANDADAHFYICKFYDFQGEDIPDPEDICEQLAILHNSESPNGKFGFECVTYNGNLPQDNTWFDNWEAFFAHGLRHVLNLREERGGTCAELDDLLPHLFDVVIPRLLRPLESDGRKVKPSLVHGDLWYGNTGITSDTKAVVYDPASFWAHNECRVSLRDMQIRLLPAELESPLTCFTDELGNWRPDRNRFSGDYIAEYHRLIPKSEPVEDWDDRNALYELKFASTIIVTPATFEHANAIAFSANAQQSVSANEQDVPVITDSSTAKSTPVSITNVEV
ncbi:unnamed protein product [Clonostachys rosea]|uniref:protein-ribulosamine 3-kinase n=1 Tax=Bionectria ochroleuca TaxID=29856 RepID=A0ABY6UDD9_BIOOC|nr:unnamed protein product [Clonostachys rosea]